MAYQEKWDVVPPAIVSLFAIATANGFKHKPTKAAKKKPDPAKLTPTKPSDRAAELQGLFKMFPTGNISVNV